MSHLDKQQNLNYQLDTQESSDQSRNFNRSSQASNSKLCSFYSNYGFCKFGQNCKFLHQRKYFPSNKPTHRKEAPLKSTALKVLPKAEKNAMNSKYNSNETTRSRNFRPRTCQYYKAGHCEKGENCLYNHDSDTYNFSREMTLPKYNDNLKKDIKAAVSKKKSIPICHYFRRGSCLKGDQCKYYHNPKYQKENNTLSDINENSLSDLQTNSNENICHQRNTEQSCVNSAQSDAINSENTTNLIASSEISSNQENSESLQESKHLNMNASNDVTTYNHIRIQIPQNSRIFNLGALSESSLGQLRNTEITQLKKRFPKLKEDRSSFTFDFEPTDPDWPFDTKSLHLEVTFPESYPLEVCNISVVSHMNYMPGVLLRHLNQSISEWLFEKHNAAIEQNQVVLLFRPFLKWFDKSLEELFNFGLKKVTEDEGTQNADNKLALLENEDPLSYESNTKNDIFEKETFPLSNNTNIQVESEKETSDSLPRQKTDPTVLNNSQMQGSKVIFTGLELVEGAAALSCKKLAVTVQCSRCKTLCNKILIPNKNTPMICSKCSRNMECNFNPSILHQFSSVLGTIYLMECQAIDVNLVECAFFVDCLSCSKQVSVDGLHYGQKQKLWCKFCNQKLIIGIESVKFQSSSGASVTTSNKVITVKKVTKVKDPVIKEGCPLPEYGACKHYKKSYRWLRFPCCGRLYPCDLCHDEKESDHDMKYASRMVCGFCSKEQPYSKEKPCFGCSANMTKKSGSYWEGGQGCRNSVTMSRKDAHKFSGMSKTTSKKSQPTGKKKK